MGLLNRSVFLPAFLGVLICLQTVSACSQEDAPGVLNGPEAAASGPPAFGPDVKGFAGELADGFSSFLRTLVYFNDQGLTDSPLNPHNVLAIPSTGLTLAMRPDLALDFRVLHLALKPRLYAEWQRWEEGAREGEGETDVDVFVNEWLVRAECNKGLFISYGRENLQWGPGLFISPSNPFFADNGQANPKLETAGMDFGRVVFIPGGEWTFSFIANTGRGQQDLFGEFKPVYAFKMDYAAYKKYGSLILSRREDEDLRVAAFAGATVSDAILIHGEAAFFKGSELYALKQSLQDVLPDLAAYPDPDHSLQGQVLLGGSYTFETGPTVGVEYVYNSAGFSDSDVKWLFEALRTPIPAPFSPTFQTSFSSDFVSGKSLGPNFKALRKNYLVVQYSHPQIWDSLDLGIRGTYGLDDTSSQVILMASRAMGDNAQLFLVANKGVGPADGEFRLLLDGSIMAGVEVTF